MDFSTAWSYLGIANQILAATVLWTGAAYLKNKGKAHWMCSIPAAFRTYVCGNFLIVAPLGLQMSPVIGNIAGAVVGIAQFMFCIFKGAKPKTL